MQTHTKTEKTLVLEKISKRYKTALLCYVFPFFFIVLLIIDINTFHATDAFFFLVFLFSILPLSIVGLVFNIFGLKLSRKINHMPKKNIGYTNLMLGIPIFLIGIFALALTFVMVLE
jgi:hypothetical protein